MRTPNQVKRELNEIAAKFATMVFDNPGMKGALIGHLNKACGSDGERHLLFKYLFGKLSSKELTGGEWVALTRWMELERVGDDWLTSAAFQEEAERIVDAECGVITKKTYTFD